jgi:hypothetical protein
MSRARAALAAALGAAIALASPAPAGAEPAQRSSADPQVGPLVPVLTDDDPRDDFSAFPLVVPHDKHHLRAGLEVSAVVFVGFVDYLLNTAARGGVTRTGDEQWALRYEWEDLRGKLVGSAYELDANRIGTNYVAHPAAGVLYYHSARSNHLSFAESWIFATLGSLLWDYFGEIREKVSINDSIVTPTAGAAIGESMMQLSGFFDRGTKSAHNGVLSVLFAPIKSLNYLFDGAEPLRTKHPDALGFPTEPWHRFELRIGGGMTNQGATVDARGARFPGGTTPDLSVALDLSIANLPGYDRAGRHARIFDDGNVSSLSARGGFSEGQLVDGLFATRVLPVGYYVRDARTDERGRTRGFGDVLAMRIGFEYGEHDFDRDRARPRDLVSMVSPLGVAAEHVFHTGGLRVRTGVDIYGSIAGVKPYALTDFRAQLLDETGLPTATRNNRYYHGLGVTVEPTASVRYGAFELEAGFRLDTMRAIERLDESEAANASPVSMNDRRSVTRATLALHPPSSVWRLGIGGQRATRNGNVGPVHASRSETSIFGTFGLVF